MLARVVKTIGIVSLLLGLSGCVTTTAHAPASEAEKSASISLITACLDKYVQKLDDGKTDPLLIAVAIVKGPCAREQAVVVEVQGRDIPPEKRPAFDKKVDYVSYTIAKEAILVRRRKAH